MADVDYDEINFSSSHNKDQIRSKSCQPRNIKYFTTGRKISEKGLKIIESEIPKAFEIPLELQSIEGVKKFWEEEKKKKIKERQKTLPNRHNYRSRVSNLWKCERLFVAADNKLPGGSITDDIDPNFFKIVSGRPIKEKKNMREYLKDIRECFLTRLKTGYYLDQILLMDEKHRIEKRELNRVSRNFNNCLKSFESFLEEDHISSKTLLEAAKREEAKSNEKLEMISKLKMELKDTQAEVLVVEENWRNCRMFQKFLYIIAPSEWRKIHDPYFGGKDVGVIASDPCLFDSFREFPGDKKIDLEVKISKFKEDIKEEKPPTLYFTDPQQILNILSDLERNNLRALAHSKELDFPVENMMAGVEKARIQFQQDQKCLEEEIKFLRDLVEAEEKKWRASEEELRKVAFGLFRDLITNEEYLTVMAYLEDVYEDAVAPNDSNLDLITMIKEIELKHESLLLALDILPNNIMTQTTRKFYREQKRRLKEAREAERKVRQMEMLLKRLSKSLEPPKKGTRERKMAARSTPPDEFTFKFEMPKVLSKEEREELFFYGKTPDDVKLFKPLWA